MGIKLQGLGRWLDKHRGEIVDGMRFDSERDEHSKQHKWFVDRIEVKG